MTPLQSELHPLESNQFPSSQSSGPFHLLFPQTSQTSGSGSGIKTQSELGSIVQVEEHPSPFTILPSSQASPPLLREFPHKEKQI